MKLFQYKKKPCPANPRTACIFMANTLLNDYARSSYVDFAHKVDSADGSSIRLESLSNV